MCNAPHYTQLTAPLQTTWGSDLGCYGSKILTKTAPNKLPKTKKLSIYMPAAGIEPGLLWQQKAMPRAADLAQSIRIRSRTSGKTPPPPRTASWLIVFDAATCPRASAALQAQLELALLSIETRASIPPASRIAFWFT